MPQLGLKGRPCQSYIISTYCHSTKRSCISANGRGIPQSPVTPQTFGTQSNIQKNLQIGMGEKLYKVKNDHSYISPCLSLSGPARCLRLQLGMCFQIQQSRRAEEWQTRTQPRAPLAKLVETDSGHSFADWLPCGRDHFCIPCRVPFCVDSCSMMRVWIKQRAWKQPYAPRTLTDDSAQLTDAEVQTSTASCAAGFDASCSMARTLCCD